MSFTEKLPSGHCGGCAKGSSQDPDQRGRLTPHVLVVFVLPLFLAVVGALSLTSLGTTASSLGGLGGLVLGLILAAVIGRLTSGRGERANDETRCTHCDDTRDG